MGDSSWANMLGSEVIRQVSRMQEEDKVEDAQDRLKPLIPLIAEVKADPNLSRKFIEGIESASEIRSVMTTAPHK